MKLLIVGSRNITNFSLLEHIPKETTLIISGGASGVDRLAEEYADTHRISKLILRPEYAKYGKVAPLKRNETMVELADEVLIIWDGASKGAKYTADFAKKKNKPLTLLVVPNTKKSNKTHTKSVAVFTATLMFFEFLHFTSLRLRQPSQNDECPKNPKREYNRRDKPTRRCHNSCKANNRSPQDCPQP